MNEELTNLQVHLMQRKYPCGLRNGFQFSPTSFLTSLNEHCFGVSVTTTKKKRTNVFEHCFVLSKSRGQFYIQCPLHYLQSAVISFCRGNLVEVNYRKSSIKPPLSNKPPPSNKPPLFRGRKLISPPSPPPIILH